jgi:hypothetical protein
MSQPNVALYLRADGSLMLVRENTIIEMQLTPGQLLQIGVDALRVATSLQPDLMAEALGVLESTEIVPMQADPSVRLN